MGDSNGWDLHCHTVFSDGTRTPHDLVELAKDAGLAGVAITDHDTCAGWGEAQDAARELDFPLICGSEITADMRSISVHILAYLYDPDDEEVRSLFAAIDAERIGRARKMVANISKDFPITWKDVVSQVKVKGRTTIGRPHIADALVKAGVYPNRSAAFKGAVSGRAKYYVPISSPLALDVVEIFKAAGGVVVIAHAAARNRNRLLLSDTDFEFLIAAGIDGIEVHHRENGSMDQKHLMKVARRHDLLVTGGSDWHGDGKPNRIGEHVTDEKTVSEIIRRGTYPVVR
jgi:predicted metal-dependent phosphoesterase TrpH